MKDSVREIAAPRVIPWDREFYVSSTLGPRHVAVPIGQKREAETVAQTALGIADAAIKDLEGKAEARFA